MTRPGLKIWQASADNDMWVVSGRQDSIPLNITYTWQEAIEWADKYLKVERGTQHLGNGREP